MTTTEAPTAAKQEKILERVRQLLAIAEHPNTGQAEADVALSQANSLMAKYAIDEAVARAHMSEEERKAPTKIRFAFSTSGNYEFMAYMRTILQEVAKTNRCQAVTFPLGETEVYGMEQDVHWVELLYLSIYSQFLSKINPRWDESKGYDENVYNFKTAGYKWSAINKEAVKHSVDFDARVWEETRSSLKVNDDGTLPTEWYRTEIRNVVAQEPLVSGKYIYCKFETPTDKIKGTMIAAYKRHMKVIGDTNPIATQSHDAYRRQFTEAFATRISRRLQEMRESNETDTKSTTGAEVALLDLSREIRDMMFGDHPHLDPKNQMEQARQARAAREAMLDAMSPSERAKFLEKEQKQQRAYDARNRKYWEQQDRQFDMAAHQRGQRAADTVDLSRKAGAAHGSAAKGALGE